MLLPGSGDEPSKVAINSHSQEGLRAGHFDSRRGLSRGKREKKALALVHRLVSWPFSIGGSGEIGKKGNSNSEGFLFVFSWRYPRPSLCFCRVSPVQVVSML